MKRIIGTREFTDGSQRAVYQDDEGRQFVIDDEGQAVYGIWLLPDEPAVIHIPEGLGGDCDSGLPVA
jgi:hypothetical protein